MNDFVTPEQYSILVGGMLGDGTLDKHPTTRRNSRYSEDHGVLQRDWLLWVRNQLTPNVYISYWERKRVALKWVNGKAVKDPTRFYQICCLRTGNHPLFTKMESEWYKRNPNGSYALHKKRRIKQLPTSLVLNPLTVAVWYMGDGHNAIDGNRLDLCTNCFTRGEVERLASELNQLYNYECRVVRHRLTQFIIRIPPNNRQSFIKMVQTAIPDMPECMRYKVDGSVQHQTFIWIGSKYINLGSYKSTERAKSVRDEAVQMKDAGVTDIQAYKDLRTRSRQ